MEYALLLSIHDSGHATESPQTIHLRNIIPKIYVLFTRS
jgi:hypothetical protein